MSAAASGLVEAMQIAHEPSNWDYIPIGPTSWFVYGGGGIGGSGSLCGVPNGVGSVLNMCGQTGLAKSVIDYYQYTAFPTDAVNQAYNPTTWTVGQVPIDYDQLIPTVSLSPLCHVSISKYCAANGVTLKDTDAQGNIYKNDRCCKIACDVAAFALGLLQGETYVLQGPSQKTTTCIGCHNTSADSVIPAQQGNMECGYCHDAEAVIIPARHPGPSGGGPHK
jgi:hypothetical protein